MTSEAKEPSEAAIRAAMDVYEAIDTPNTTEDSGADMLIIATAIDTAVQDERDALVQYLTDLDDFTESIVGGLREAIKRGEHVSPTPDPPTPGDE